MISRKILNVGKAMLSFLLLVAPGLNTQAQGKPTLTIGDKVPELKYGQWLKGEPVTSYEKGRLYIFEFWATWCGPCIASMPHLSEFAKEHKDKVSVIAVNIWEKTGDKPYESSWPKVTRFVEQMGDKMGFAVMTDSKDEFMSHQWMKAAGQSGIPCSFMVKDGIIQWIGHPIKLDSIVKVVSDEKYDVMAAREAAIKRSENVDPNMESFSRIFKAYEDAVAAKQYKYALQILDSGMTVNENFNGTFGFFKFQLLLDHFKERKALAYAKKWQKSRPGYVGSTGAVIVNKPGLSKATYKYGIELVQSLLENPNMPPSSVYEMMAKGYANMKDYKSAVEYQEKTVSSAREALKEGKFAGFILPDKVTEFETVLDEYKKKLKK